MRQLMFRVLPRKAFISLLSQMQEQLGAAARRWKVSVATCMRTSILSKFLQLNRAYACLPLRRSRVRKVKLTKLLEDRSNFRPVSLPVELHADQTSEKYLQVRDIVHSKNRKHRMQSKLHLVDDASDQPSHECIVRPSNGSY
eukprot:c19962_g1_i2 orf=484-909(-)